jgi:hypothetical protein
MLYTVYLYNDFTKNGVYDYAIAADTSKYLLQIDNCRCEFQNSLTHLVFNIQNNIVSTNVYTRVYILELKYWYFIDSYDFIGVNQVQYNCTVDCKSTMKDMVDIVVNQATVNEPYAIQTTNYNFPVITSATKPLTVLYSSNDIYHIFAMPNDTTAATVTNINDTRTTYPFKVYQVNLSQVTVDLIRVDYVMTRNGNAISNEYFTFAKGFTGQLTLFSSTNNQRFLVTVVSDNEVTILFDNEADYKAVALQYTTVANVTTKGDILQTVLNYIVSKQNCSIMSIKPLTFVPSSFITVGDEIGIKINQLKQINTTRAYNVLSRTNNTPIAINVFGNKHIVKPNDIYRRALDKSNNQIMVAISFDVNPYVTNYNIKIGGDTSNTNNDIKGQFMINIPFTIDNLALYLQTNNQIFAQQQMQQSFLGANVGQNIVNNAITGNVLGVGNSIVNGITQGAKNIMQMQLNLDQVDKQPNAMTGQTSIDILVNNNEYNFSFTVLDWWNTNLQKLLDTNGYQMTYITDTHSIVNMLSSSGYIDYDILYINANDDFTTEFNNQTKYYYKGV